MILAQSFSPFGHSGPSRPTGSSSSYGSVKPPPGRSKLPPPGSPAGHRASSPVVKWRCHPNTSLAPCFPSPPFLLRAKTGAINGRWLTSSPSSTSRPLMPYKMGATPPAISTMLILAPLSSTPLPERLAHRAPPPSFAPHRR
jgi:hypothetical protein